MSIRHGFSPVLCVLACVAAQLAISAEGPVETTETKLKKYGEELKDTIATYPADNQRQTRETHNRDLAQAFEAEVNSMDLPPIPTMQKAVDNFCDNLDRSRLLFKIDKAKDEKSSYVRGSGLVFKREFAAAKDYANTRTVYQIFELFMNLSENIRQKVHQLPSEVRLEAYSTLNACVNDMIQNGTIPDKVDHTRKFDDMMKEIRLRFPMRNDAESKTNSNLAQQLESAARNIQQRCIRK